MENQKPIVLVVDDDEMMGRMLRRVFKRVEEAEFRIIDGPGCAATALEFARIQAPVLVISDVDLGDGDPADGIELCRALRALPDPPRVVLVSGMTSPERFEAAAAAGAAHLEAKPFVEVVALVLGHLRAELAWRAVPRLS